ncbi:DUF2273 domain-containing protein [Galbitalea soli]|uniref:DUF2273 domain-containing protein n=1 Tax=Galbitalea soli TaxID=1268042 RepID=A0A7C9TRN2_9MICO|nr:DUF2273 domain-containing protein [Galbitalea soli]NEM91620.1 DUF2273 domain-containing protein [Galbitalea soli]NYJ30314.1 putative membrane protein [Galbitalea soli]
MSGTLIGAIAGVVLAIVALAFGFWGFLLAVVLGAIGAVIGASVTGRLDLAAVLDAVRGRRSA